MAQTQRKVRIKNATTLDDFFEIKEDIVNTVNDKIDILNNNLSGELKAVRESIEGIKTIQKTILIFLSVIFIVLTSLITIFGFIK